MLLIITYVITASYSATSKHIRNPADMAATLCKQVVTVVLGTKAEIQPPYPAWNAGGHRPTCRTCAAAAQRLGLKDAT